MERPEDIDGVQIIAEIARSASSLVLKGYQPQLERFILVKCLANSADDPGFAERFRNEAVMLARLSDPSIPAVYDFASTATRAHIIAEFVDGLDLARISKERALPVPIALYVARECAKALRAAHAKGILHRDVKPGNVMLAFSGRVLLTDFGLADFAHESRTSIAGTAAYLAPEVIVGGHASECSDIFALGATLFEALTGEPAFKRDSASATINAVANANPIPRLAFAAVPDSVQKLVGDLLAKEPTERIESAQCAVEKIADLVEKNGWKIDRADLEAYLADPHSWAKSGAPAVATKKDVNAIIAAEPVEAQVQDATVDKRRPMRYALAALSVVVLALLAGVLSSQINGAEVASQPGRATADLGKQANLVGGPTGVGAATDGPRTTEEAALEFGLAAKPEGRSQETGLAEPEASRESSYAELDTSREVSHSADIQTDTVAHGTTAVPGVLQIDVLPWGVVAIDDSVVGRTPLPGPVEVPPGLRSVTVTNPTLPTIETQVLAESGQTNRLALSLWDSVTRLHIEVVPWAHVSVDGAFWQTTPHRSPLVLQPGRHQIVLEHPDLGAHSAEYDATAGVVDTLSINMAENDK